MQGLTECPYAFASCLRSQLAFMLRVMLRTLSLTAEQRFLRLLPLLILTKLSALCNAAAAAGPSAFVSPVPATAELTTQPLRRPLLSLSPQKRGTDWRPMSRRQHRHSGTSLALSLPTPELDTPEAIAFTLANCGVTPFWLLMVFLPNWSLTQSVMKTPIPVALTALCQLSMFVYGLGQPDAQELGTFFVSEAVIRLSAMVQMRESPIFVAEEWAHALTWDLLAGQLIYLDGLRRGINTSFALAVTFAAGPPGYLLHLLMVQLSKLGGGVEREDADVSEEMGMGEQAERLMGGDRTARRSGDR
ncbi:unnamed protein product [Vitrella brassicaformis CCMP3155]|uniref:Uncharacterized protein n=1 Tax=Vitrella brassicaformis (strain CCMP3155) TaxID=1169540 RepID=A0A0G4EVJ8_VITBC|nr:unnamed protein product [Vitrella brassicaformis CCMP3155]|eukprot:CEM02661.1 unnamed protein product [Vitrella brassicaformis CCMP3155]